MSLEGFRYLKDNEPLVKKVYLDFKSLNFEQILGEKNKILLGRMEKLNDVNTLKSAYNLEMNSKASRINEESTKIDELDFIFKKLKILISEHFNKLNLHLKLIFYHIGIIYKKVSLDGTIRHLKSRLNLKNVIFRNCNFFFLLKNIKKIEFSSKFDFKIEIKTYKTLEYQQIKKEVIVSCQNISSIDTLINDKYLKPCQIQNLSIKFTNMKSFNLKSDSINLTLTPK